VDFSSCEFFDANMAAPLGAILARITDRLNEVELISLSKGIQSVLCQNQFLASYGYPALDDGEQTTLPFQRIPLAEKGLFAEYLGRHLQGKGVPKMSERLERAFQQKIFEVFQNAVTHSESRFGVFVCGQSFPTKKRLELTLADAGIGIRENVRRFFQNDKISSAAAIRWALVGGNTTKQGKEPGGLGLKLLKDFFSLNEGKIQIASRMGCYVFENGKETFSTMSADFPGTVVNFEINTSDPRSYRFTSEPGAKN